MKRAVLFVIVMTDVPRLPSICTSASFVNEYAYLAFGALITKVAAAALACMRVNAMRELVTKLAATKNKT